VDYATDALSVAFDEHNLVPNAGLIALAMFTQRLGIADLMQHTMRPDNARPGAANSGAKAMDRARRHAR
jgi:hypothetical protein